MGFPVSQKNVIIILEMDFLSQMFVLANDAHLIGLISEKGINQILSGIVKEAICHDTHRLPA